MMNNNVEIEVIDALPIKCMTMGKVNGHHTNMRSRYMEEADRIRDRAILTTAGAYIAGLLTASAILIAILYVLP